MKRLSIAVLTTAAICLVVSFSFAKQHLPEERGKTIFNDAKFAGGSKSCNTCHPEGKGLDKAGEKKEFKIFGKTQKSLEEALNVCIVGGNNGKAIDEKSDQMKDLVAFIKSLKPKAAEKK